MITTTDVKRCVRCILPGSLPSVELDEEGVCGHCRTYDEFFRDWEEVRSKRKRELEDLLQRVKRLGRTYDCLVPLSGGKDSTYVLYVLSKVYGLKCLCVTFDNGFLSKHARTNIRNALEATGTDHMFYSVNRDLLLRLYKLFLTKCGNFCSVCMRGINVSVEAAVRAFGIPLVVGGHGRRISYLSIVPELFEGGDKRFFERVIDGEELEGDVGSLLHTFPRYGEELVRRLYRFRVVRVGLRLLGISWDLVPLVTPHIGLYDWMDISYDQVYSAIRREMGWTAAVEQSEHMDCILHEIPSYMHTLKFPELTTGTVYRSGLIRLGLMTKADAMSAENDDLTNLQSPQVLDSFLKEIGMSRNDFESAAQNWRSMEEFRMTK